MEESEQFGICLPEVIKEEHRRSRRESIREDLVSKSISNVLKNQTLFQKTEQMLKSINKDKKKSTSRCSTTEDRQKERRQIISLQREKADFLRGISSELEAAGKFIYI